MNVFILIIGIDMITLIYDISEINLNNCIKVKNINFLKNSKYICSIFVL